MTTTNPGAGKHAAPFTVPAPRPAEQATPAGYCLICGTATHGVTTFCTGAPRRVRPFREADGATRRIARAQRAADRAAEQLAKARQAHARAVARLRDAEEWTP